MNTELKNLFDSLGFNETQLAVYLSLVSFGKASATQIAKASKLPRSTIYSSLDGLLPSGLVSLDSSSKIKYFVASSPESIERFVTKKKQLMLEKFIEEEKNAKDLIGLLKPYFQGQKYNVPKIQFYEGEVSISNMLYEHTKIWQESVMSHDKIWWGYQDHHFVETYREWLDYYWRILAPGEAIHLLSNKSSTEKSLKGKLRSRSIKLVPKQFEFSSTIWAIGDYIVCFSTREKPQYAFQIKDTVLSSSLRNLFKLCWTLVN